MREPIEKYRVIDAVRKMDVNGKMPHNKLIKACSDDEIMKALNIFKEEFSICENTFGDIPNILGNLLLEKWRASDNPDKLYIIGIAMAAIKVLNDRQQSQQSIMQLMDIDLLQKKLDVEIRNKKIKVKQEEFKSDLSVSQKNYFKGKQDMLNEIKKYINGVL